MIDSNEKHFFKIGSASHAGGEHKVNVESFKFAMTYPPKDRLHNVNRYIEWIHLYEWSDVNTRPNAAEMTEWEMSHELHSICFKWSSSMQ